jgi:branched-chain amino acid transport system permease protein
VLELLGLNEPLVAAMAISAVAALAFYVVFAAGQFNVAQPGFMAIGAYAVALTTTSGDGIVLGMVVGLLASTAAGLLITGVTIRLSGVYLAMATLAFVQMVVQVINITPALKGPLGIYGIPRSLGPWTAWAMVIGIAIVVHRVMRSRLGYEMRILREDPVSARGIGIDDVKVKLVVGGLSGALAGLAGGMQAITTSYISPDEFGFALLILILSFAIVGGTDRYWGAIVGAIVLTALPEYTRDFQEYRLIFSGAVVLLVVVLFPEGIAGAIVRAADAVRRRGAREGAGAEGREPDGTAEDVAAAWPARAAEAPDAGPVLSATGLAKRFGGVHAVDGVDLELRAACVHGVIGANGAGKSTLVDLLSGEQRPDAGVVTLERQDVTRMAAHRRSRLGVARTFQTTRLTQNMTVREVSYSSCLMADRPSALGKVIGMPGVRRRYKRAWARSGELLDLLGLGAVGDRYVRDIGWEEQRRLEIGRALALDPKVLLLDEPTAGMHAEALPRVGKLVQTIAASGAAVVLIEHNVAFIRETVDTLLAVDLGRVVARGDAATVLADRAVIDSYLGVAEVDDHLSGSAR